MDVGAQLTAAPRQPHTARRYARQGAAKAVQLVKAFREQGHDIRFLNMGGGFGISYRKQEALPAAAFAEVILPAVRETGCKLVLEPGRFIVSP